MQHMPMHINEKTLIHFRYRHLPFLYITGEVKEIHTLLTPTTRNQCKVCRLSLEIKARLQHVVEDQIN